MKLNKLIISILSAIALFMTACSDDDEPKIPTNAITVNLMNSDNGGTTIGESDVYINSSNNFVSLRCGIVDLGRKGSFSQNPNLKQIAREVAVTPGNFYQIVLTGDLREIAGARAFPITGIYYNLYVDSWIYDSDKDISGAKVQYAECTPSIGMHILPEWNTSFPVYMKFREDNKYAEYDTHTFDKNVKIDTNYDIYNVKGTDLASKLTIKIIDNKIEFSNSSYTPNCQVEVVMYVRYESIYTKVRFLVSSDQH